MNFRIGLLIFTKKPCWGAIGAVLYLCMNLSRTDIFPILSHPIYKCVISLHESVLKKFLNDIL